MLSPRPGLGWALFLVMLCLHPCWSAPKVSLEPVGAEVDVNAFVEVTVQVSGTEAKNPFVDASVTGSFQLEGAASTAVSGFCDSTAGAVHRIRFLPQQAGTYSYTLTYQEVGFAQTFTGRFIAKASLRKGLLRVDPAHPYHFIWNGTQDHCFLNGTTTYWMLGLEDDNEIKTSLERLAALKVNRIRVALCGRTESGKRWFEPQVVWNDKFKMRLNPWEAARPESAGDPGFEVTRFNLDHWQKCDRLLRIARRQGIAVSLIFYLDGADPGVEPFGKTHAANEDEKRYFSYAANRFSAYANVAWDLCNEYHLMRDDAWANTMGEFLRTCDPYDHLMSVHGSNEFHFRAAPWADYCLYQAWDASGGYDFMLKNRGAQELTGHPKPQINEEYGYEDHYPQGWGDNLKAPARDAENRRRLAWGMVMAGGYQTTGERATKSGGWINGRGDDELVMLKGYAHMVDFFQSFDWWACQPDASVIKAGAAWCLAESGKTYAFYLPQGGTVKIALPDGKFTAELYHCRTGERQPLGELPGGEWTAPSQSADEDAAILIRNASGS